MGSFITLPGEVTTSPFGKFHAYEGTWDSTVYLWDAEYAPLSALPATNSVLPNLLRTRAAEVSGLSVSSCDFDVSNSLNNGSAILASGEITSKGAPHVASPQSGGQVANSHLGLAMQAGFANWLLSQTDAGADYALLVTLFLRCTRAHATGTGVMQSMAHIVSVSSATLNKHFLMQPNSGPTAGSGVPLVGNQNVPTVAGTAGAGFVSSQGWGGTKPTDLNSAQQRRLLSIGCSDAWGGFNFNACGSYVAYRTQLDLVDLTDIVGADRAAKCNAKIAALNAMATRDFAAGGRFYGDTFTAAATLKP